MATPDGAVALGVGTALALGAALVVLRPLWTGAGDDATPEHAAPARPGPGASSPAGPAARTEGVTAVEALREIEFDRATGKLADDDYAALKATYTREALAELRAKDAPAVEPTVPAAAVADDDPVEVALRAYRARRGEGTGACPEHGARPEPDAVFCSACGRFLAAHCPHCGAACGREGQRFCTACGGALAPTVVGAAAIA